MINNTGPPEYPGESRYPVSQAIDIWSLGCVFSLAATWAIMGFVGVLQFNEVRMRAIDEINRKRQIQSSSVATAEDELAIDQFHDGYKLLDEVTLWHKYLRGRVRKCDTISAQVLDLIDKKMLIPKPEERIKAGSLCKRLEKMLAHSFEEPLENIPMKILNHLKDLDETVANRLESMRHSKDAEQGNANGTNEGSPKPRPIDLMLKTTHRQSILPSDGKQAHQRTQPRNVKPPAMTLEKHLEDTSLPSPHPSQRDETTRGHRGTNSYRLRKMPRKSRKAKQSSRHPPQNVFQAREAVKNREKGAKKFLAKFFRRHRQKKDEVLESYFKDRDIVSLQLVPF